MSRVSGVRKQLQGLWQELQHILDALQLLQVERQADSVSAKYSNLVLGQTELAGSMCHGQQAAAHTRRGSSAKCNGRAAG